MESATITWLNKPETANHTAMEELVDIEDDNLVIFPMALKEYNEMVNETNGELKKIGSNRYKAGWLQTIGLTTIQDAINQIAWHMSKGHVQVADAIVLLAVPISLGNWVSHAVQRTMPSSVPTA